MKENKNTIFVEPIIRTVNQSHNKILGIKKI